MTAVAVSRDAGLSGLMKEAAQPQHHQQQPQALRSFELPAAGSAVPQQSALAAVWQAR
jgi:hypothetical protein